MKKILLVAISMLASAAAFAQGTVLLANGSGTLVKFGTTPDVPTALQGLSVPTGTTANPSDFRVALYWLNGGSWSQLGAAASIAPVAGRFSGGSRGNSAAAPGTETFKVVAWSGGATFSSYEAALASGNASVFVGETSPFSQATGGTPAGGGAPVAAPALGAGFTGLTVRPVPEPSIVALGLLGAAALLIRRRN